MSVEMYAILIGIILILIDIFFASDIPTFIAILLFSFSFYRCLHFKLVVNIILVILFFFAVLIVYVTCWKKVKELVVDKWYAKDKYKAGVYGFVGKHGIVKCIEGKKYALIDGDLYAFFEEYNLNADTQFIVQEVRDGMIIIKE